MPRTIIVYGPPACGKTRNAARMANHFGLEEIVDDWDPARHHLRPGALHLTHACPDVVSAECYRFSDQLVGEAASLTARWVGRTFKTRADSRKAGK